MRVAETGASFRVATVRPAFGLAAAVGPGTGTAPVAGPGTGRGTVAGLGTAGMARTGEHTIVAWAERSPACIVTTP